MDEKLLARRARNLATGLPVPHFPCELGAGVIAFDSGFAAAELLPDLLAFATQALTKRRAETLQYSPTQGQVELRTWIAQYMTKDGSAVSPDNVMIVNGAKQGLDLLCRLLLDEGDAIVVTAPTYFAAIPIFRSFGAEFIEASQDAAGLRIERLEELLAARRALGRAPPKFIYNVADFHNPSGVTMPEARRRALIDIAQRDGILVVEDSPYRRVRFEGASVPSLKSLDRADNVIHVGTFSKLIAPGLRLGWIATSEDIIARLIQLKSDGGTSPLIQRIVYEFCSSPMFETHASLVCATYRERRDRMLAAIRRELPDVRLLVPEGGYYVWITLPDEVDGDAFARRAAAVGVNLIPGSRFFAGPAAHPNDRRASPHVRLSYSFATPDQIDEGLRRLAEVYQTTAA